MDSVMEKLVDSPALTDYSFVDFTPTPDLYDRLLSDHSDHLEVGAPDSSERQPTQEEELLPVPEMVLPVPPSPTPKAVAYRCSCTKSKCSKNYCECFRSGRQCSAECGCTNCANGVSHSSSSGAAQVVGGGCNCKKTRCLKKYCECHSKGTKCTANCNCLSCENTQDAVVVQPDPTAVLLDDFYL